MNTADKHKDVFLKQAVKLSTIEKPGDDFTASVMDKIAAANVTEAEKISLSATPLITWKGWIMVTGIIITIISLLQFTNPIMINFAHLNQYFNKIGELNLEFNISISKIFLIGLITLVFFFMIEISLIMKRIKE